jgi:hypothetical protein
MVKLVVFWRFAAGIHTLLASFLIQSVVVACAHNILNKNLEEKPVLSFLSLGKLSKLTGW